MSDINDKKGRPLRSGYTTGACASASAKAATLRLLGAKGLRSVEIPFPDGRRIVFKIKRCGLAGGAGYASVIKDAGDDPDVTNKAEIAAEARIIKSGGIVIKGGDGVGTVTLPGLPIQPGGPAINPVPKMMIADAVMEAVKESGRGKTSVEITISVTDGKKIAKKTLNQRLGIMGGISILGTTGDVRPLSSSAWKATISSGMSVARAMGFKKIALSSGRTSERGHMKAFGLPDASYVMMGDYVEFSLKEAGRFGFEKIHLSAQWAKMLKIAMGIPDTHVRAGAIDTEEASEFLISLGIKIEKRKYNTAREIFDTIKDKAELKKVCASAKSYAEKTSGIKAGVYLVSYEGDIITGNE